MVTIKGAVQHSYVRISDALGRLMFVKELTLSEEKINLGELVNGIYMFSIYDEAGKTIKTGKLIKN